LGGRSEDFYSRLGSLSRGDCLVKGGVAGIFPPLRPGLAPLADGNVRRRQVR